MSRVEELVSTLQQTLEELAEIETESNRQWREYNEELSVLDHELEIVPLNGGQLLKVASYRRKIRIERRARKNDWYLSKAFNDVFGTTRVLNSMNNAQRALRRQAKQGENLIEDRGLIASILSGDKPILLGAPTNEVVVIPEVTDQEVLQETAKKIAASFVEMKEPVDSMS